MSRRSSPFAELTGDERQIKWLEYQSLKLPYVQPVICDEPAPAKAAEPEKTTCAPNPPEPPKQPPVRERPQPPPEVPRVMPVQSSRHSQYDAVIARMKQAELQSRRSQSTSKAPQ